MTSMKNLRADLLAGVVVFFVAVPLCLGIALASGAPLISGLVSGIIGGVVVGAISRSRVGVSGPAAGLAVIVLGAIAELGMPAFLAALVMAGVMQIVLGLGRAGFIAHFFPSAAIRGMLAGIGIVIILKQIPHALGHDSDPEGEMSFVQPDGDTTMSSLRSVLGDFEPSAMLVAAVSLAILLVWDSVLAKRNSRLKLIPAPILAVGFGIVFQMAATRFAPSLALSGSHLVSVPVAGGLGDLFELLPRPDLARILDGPVLLTAATVAIVASLETLLCVEATDKMDPEKFVTPTNRELVAQGIGNSMAGLLGGLPVTQVIVRSSANIQSGAKTKNAAICHGLLLLAFVVVLPQVLNLIPLAVLASILFVVGYKLAKPSLFRQMYALGWSQFIPFVATILGIVFTDLLIGITIGLGIAVMNLLHRSYRNSHFLHAQETCSASGRPLVKMRLAEEVTFLNRGAIVRALDRIPDNARVTIDRSKALFIDPDVIEVIEDFREVAKGRGIEVVLSAESAAGAAGEADRSEDVASFTHETQAAMTPALALQRLRDGNARFVANRPASRDLLGQVAATREGQWPFAAVLGCIDSRASAEIVFDQGIGDIFSVRVAGNFVNADILGSLEFACEFAGAKLVVVLGHTGCGAVKGACDGVSIGHLAPMLENLKPALDAVPEPKEPAARTSANTSFVQAVAERNVALVVAEIRARSAILRDREASGDLAIVGAMYDVATGLVRFDLEARAAGAA